MALENFISAQEMIMTAFTNIEKAELERNNLLLKTWRTTLESIRSNAENGKNLGTNLYSHSRIIDLKNGILLVEADHPGWIQTLRLYQKYILTGLKRNVPNLEISSLAFRLRGTNLELHTQLSEEKMKDDLSKRIQSEENAIKDFVPASNPVEAKTMPENLQKILDRLKNDILADGKA